MAVQQRNSELVALLSADFLPNHFPVNVFGGFSGFALMEIVLPNTTAITLISDELISESDTLTVKNILKYEALTVIDGGSFDVTSGELEPGDTGTLFTNAAGTVVLEVDAGGVVTIYATGTVTARVQLEIKWV